MNRNSNVDHRRRHDGKDDNWDRHGPVKHRVRHNVTEEDAHKALQELGQLSWIEQAEEIRRGNSILLGRTLAGIDAGKDDTETYANLARCSTVAKTWTVEERQGGPDLSKLSTEELAAIANKEP